MENDTVKHHRHKVATTPQHSTPQHNQTAVTELHSIMAEERQDRLACAWKRVCVEASAAPIVNALQIQWAAWPQSHNTTWPIAAQDRNSSNCAAGGHGQPMRNIRTLLNDYHDYYYDYYSEYYENRLQLQRKQHNNNNLERKTAIRNHAPSRPHSSTSAPRGVIDAKLSSALHEVATGLRAACIARKHCCRVRFNDPSAVMLELQLQCIRIK